MRNLRQLKDLIKNLAQATNVNPQILLRNYMLERLLERISISEYSDKFILKGGMLVTSLVGVDLRSTIDMDTTVKLFPVSRKSIENAFNTILSVEINDIVDMKITKINEIRSEAVYQGYRVSIDCMIEKSRTPIKVDITTGDEITPKEIVYTFDLMLEDRKIDILAYNIETVIGEKFETIISRGTANTRMRDFYDIYILMKLQINNIDLRILNEAIIATARNRGSINLLPDSKQILDEVFSSDILYNYWLMYQKEYNYAAEISWEEIRATIFSIWSITIGDIERNIY